MIIPDINLLVYAYNSGTPHHQSAKTWWIQAMNGARLVGIPWAVSFGFIRLMTHPRVLTHPLSIETCLAHVNTWISRVNVQILNPGPRHLTIAQDLFRQAGTAANLTTDVYLAALAIEYQAELHSNDADFSRFSGLRWVNPLKT